MIYYWMHKSYINIFWFTRSLSRCLFLCRLQWQKMRANTNEPCWTYILPDLPAKILLQLCWINCNDAHLWCWLVGTFSTFFWRIFWPFNIRHHQTLCHHWWCYTYHYYSHHNTLGHFTFWLRPWLTFSTEPKITFSWRWAKKWIQIFRLISATAQSELFAQPRQSPKLGLSCVGDQT